ncbi:MAG: hypothetical protein K9K82_14335 [Desulfobacteraceae bacterium]|nr:hypothetical protein [Desulfobacteraceae bacterium]
MKPLRRIHNMLFMLASGMVIVAMSVLPPPCHAEMSEMSNAQMAKIRGHGATNLYIEGNSVRLFLDVHMETYGEIDSAKAGYYENMDGANGWDMDWNNLTLGQSIDTPLVTDGLVFRVEFDDNDATTENDINASNKQLERFFIGTNNMSGQISGDFTTTTGAVHPDVVGASQTAPIVMNRGNDLQAYGALNISNSGFFIDMNLDGQSPERGIKTIVGYPETKAYNFTFSGDDWWQD